MKKDGTDDIKAIIDSNTRLITKIDKETKQ